MKRIAFAIALAFAGPSLSACGTMSAVIQAPHSQGGTRAFIAAEYALDTVVLAVEQAVDAGLLKGDNAAEAARLIRKARDVDHAARAAYALGDARGGDAQVVALTGLLSELNTLVGDARRN